MLYNWSVINEQNQTHQFYDLSLLLMVIIGMSYMYVRKISRSISFKNKNIIKKLILNTDTVGGIKCDGFKVSYGDKEKGYYARKIIYDFACIGRVFIEIRMGMETGYDIINVRLAYGGIEFDFIGWSK